MRLVRWLVAFISVAAFGQIAPPTGNRLFLRAHAVGTQNYFCDASGAWVFFSPQATLYAVVGEGNVGKQIGTHFLSPMPGKETSAATWQSSRDSSEVWGSKAASIPAGSDSGCASAGAIPCLLLKAVDHKPGQGSLARVTYIQRLATVGGMAPAGACKAGDQALVPYRADYLFYKAGGK